MVLQTFKECVRYLSVVAIAGIVVSFLMLSYGYENTLSSDQEESRLHEIKSQSNANGQGKDVNKKQLPGHTVKVFLEKRLSSDKIDDDTSRNNSNSSIKSRKEINVTDEHRSIIGSSNGTHRGNTKRETKKHPQGREHAGEDSAYVNYDLHEAAKSVKKNMDKNKDSGKNIITSSTSSTTTPKSPRQGNIYLQTSSKKIQPNKTHADSDKWTAVAERFAARKQRLEEICQTKPLANFNKHVKYREWRLAHGALAWCPVPKVCSTFIKRIRQTFDVLGVSDNDTTFLPGQRKRFFLVRDPYSRLVSGYIGKLMLTPIFWPNLGINIIKAFRNRSSRPSVEEFQFHKHSKNDNCGNDVTFSEFVKYVIYTQSRYTQRDHHFTPIYAQCRICKTNYDYVGHLETFKEDFTYILRSVNVTGEFDVNHEEIEYKGKARAVLTNKPEIRKKCEPICTTLRKTWWSFQARGFVSVDFDFPPTMQNCTSISPDEFVELAWSAHLRSLGTMDKSQQKRQILVKLYEQVSLSDRLKLRDIFKYDFELFGYDPKPMDIFPELKSL